MQDGAMETPQQGNESTKNGNVKIEILWGVS